MFKLDDRVVEIAIGRKGRIESVHHDDGKLIRVRVFFDEADGPGAGMQTFENPEKELRKIGFSKPDSPDFIRPDR
jgi:hypothetical protein